MLRYQKINASEGIDVNKTSAFFYANFVAIGFLKILDLNLKNMFVIKDIAILYAKGATFRCILMGIS